MKTLTHGLLALAAIALLSVGLFIDPASAGQAPDIARLFDTGLAELGGGLVLIGEISIKALKQKRAELHTGLEAIVTAAEGQDRDLTDEEQAAYDAAKADIAAMDKRIARAEEIEQAKLAAMTPVNPGGGGGGGSLILPPQLARGPAPRHFSGPTAREDAYKSGMFLAAALYKSPEALEWCQANGVPVMKAGRDWFDKGDPTRPRGALSTGINTSGGFLVPTEFETAIINLRFTYGVARRFCEPVTMASDTQEVPRKEGGLTAYPVGENVELTESEGGWGMVTLTARKWGVLTRWSTELNEDAIIEMADNLAMDIAKAFAYAEDNALFNGDGTSTYHGIVGIRVKLIDGSHDGSKVDAASGHDTFAEIDATDLANVKALVPDYVTNPYWLCSRQFKSLVFDRLAMAAGGVSKVEVGGRPNDAYDGDPIFTANAMPRSTGDLSDVVMALYGDLRPGVKFGSRRGMMIATTDQRYWELDQLGIKGTERFDINCHTLKGLDEDGTSAVAGPVIGLVGE